MGLSQRLQEVRAAEAKVGLHRHQLQHHVSGFKESGHDLKQAGRELLTPGRLVAGGLALGFLADRMLLPRSPTAQPSDRAGAPAREQPSGPGISQLLTQGMSLASTAMPLLMPLIAKYSAEHAADAAEDRVDEQHSSNA